MKNSLDRILDILFYGAWGLIFVTALMLYFCFPVSASGVNSGKLPIRTGETNQYFSLTEDSLGIDPQTVFSTAHSFYVILILLILIKIILLFLLIQITILI